MKPGIPTDVEVYDINLKGVACPECETVCLKHGERDEDYMYHYYCEKCCCHFTTDSPFPQMVLVLVDGTEILVAQL